MKFHAKLAWFFIEMNMKFDRHFFWMAPELNPACWPFEVTEKPYTELTLIVVGTLCKY